MSSGMSEKAPWTISKHLDSMVRGLPVDKSRVRLLQTLSTTDTWARVADVAKMMPDLPSGEVAQTIVEAAKDGLVEFDAEGRSVKTTELGARLASRQGRSAF